MAEHILDTLAETIRMRAEGGQAESRTATMIKRGRGFICQKIVEEAGETVVAALGESPPRLVEESGDLLYHLLVLWHVSGIKPEQVWDCLAKRAK